MSYKCSMCSTQVQNGIDEIRVTTQVRDVTYVTKDPRRDDKLSKGFESVKEESICPECNKKLGADFKPQVVSSVKRERVLPRPKWDKDRFKRRKGPESYGE